MGGRQLIHRSTFPYHPTCDENESLNLWSAYGCVGLFAGQSRQEGSSQVGQLESQVPCTFCQHGDWSARRL
ncbi:hypothetical protein GW17_00026411 [Ensete ventricosum]|nr:hypothetical protein GW17_00026411 [Ensete ventricosum]